MKGTAAAPQRTWKETITADTHFFAFNLREIWQRRDLLAIFIRRDLLAVYKQTILGPLWFVLQPVLTTITFVLAFSRVAKLSTLGVPPLLFYMSGIVLWSYFSECIIKTSTFLKDHNPVLSKVYFPRLIVPLAIVFTNLVKFGIQLLLFFAVYLFYLFNTNTFHPTVYAALLPLLLVLIAGMGLGAGLIVSSLTIRYKDLAQLLTFGVQLLMFTSSVIFPFDGASKYSRLLLLNPMTGVIEAFRYGFLSKGFLSGPLLLYDAACMLVLLFVGLVSFNATEKNYVDVI